MFARVSTILGKPENRDRMVRHFQDILLPEIGKMDGFKGAFLLVDQTGRSVGITLWDTDQHLQASSAAADTLRAQSCHLTGTDRPPVVEIYEVAAQG